MESEAGVMGGGTMNQVMQMDPRIGEAVRFPDSAGGMQPCQHLDFKASDLQNQKLSMYSI